MSSRLQITCVRKIGRNGDEQQSIQGIGGTGWNHTEEEAIQYVDNGVYSYYIKPKGEVVDVIVAERGGRKYLKTMLDRNRPDNLLRLPDCI